MERKKLPTIAHLLPEYHRGVVSAQMADGEMRELSAIIVAEIAKHWTDALANMALYREIGLPIDWEFESAKPPCGETGGTD